MQCILSPPDLQNFVNKRISELLKFTPKRKVKGLGQRKMWSDPILVETQLLGTFDQ